MLSQRSVPGVFLQHMREHLNRSSTLQKHAKCLNPSRQAIPVNCSLNISSGKYSVRLLCSMADCGNLSADILEWLVAHPSNEVRIAISENYGLPLEIMFVLAKDESADVRYALAENHNLPLQVLDVLLEDENPYVSCRAARTKERCARSSRSENGEAVRHFPQRPASSNSASVSA